LRDFEACCGRPGNTLDDNLAFDGAAEILRESRRTGGVASGQQDRELLAADTGRQVGTANVFADGIGGPAQDKIPDLVAAAVVDALESVEIEEHKGKRRAEAVGAGDFLLQSVHEPSPVREVGQLVGLGLSPYKVVQARVLEGDPSLRGE
jgi:hypothetical protein